MSQLDLEIPDQEPPRDDVARFILWLKSQDWVTAAKIIADRPIELPASHSCCRRRLRKLASFSEGKIISGRHGYCHISNARPDEIKHAADWLESQGKKMLERAVKIRCNFHSMA